MNVRFGWPLALIVLVPSVCHAQELSYRPTVPADAAAYCDFVKGQAHSVSALELTPKVFGTVGVLDGTFTATNASNAAQATNPQFIAGASYSLTGIYRGISINQQASAECERYRRESALHAFVEMNRLGLSVAALKARLAVLDEALPRAQDILREQQIAMANARTTLEILEATQLRLEELRTLRALARQNYDS